MRGRMGGERFIAEMVKLIRLVILMVVGAAIGYTVTPLTFAGYTRVTGEMFVQALLAVLKRHTAPLVMLPSGGSALENVKYRLPSEASVACIGMNPVGPPASALQLAPPLVLR